MLHFTRDRQLRHGGNAMLPARLRDANFRHLGKFYRNCGQSEDYLSVDMKTAHEAIMAGRRAMRCVRSCSG